MGYIETGDEVLVTNPCFPFLHPSNERMVLTRPHFHFNKPLRTSGAFYKLLRTSLNVTRCYQGLHYFFLQFAISYIIYQKKLKRHP